MAYSIIMGWLYLDHPSSGIFMFSNWNHPDVQLIDLSKTHCPTHRFQCLYGLGHGPVPVLLPGLLSTDTKTRYQDCLTSITQPTWAYIELCYNSTWFYIIFAMIQYEISLNYLVMMWKSYWFLISTSWFCALSGVTLTHWCWVMKNIAVYLGHQ